MPMVNQLKITLDFTKVFIDA